MSVVIQDAAGGPPDSEDAALWADELGLGFPVLADVDGEVYATWDAEGVLPKAAVLDREGRITFIELGGASALDDIEAAVDAAL